MSCAHPADRGGLRRLDHLDRRESLPRRALRARPRDAPRARRNADDVVLREEGRRPHLRHLLRLRRAALDRRVLPRGHRPGQEFQRADEHRRVPLPAAASTCASARRRSASRRRSVLAAAYELEVPIYTWSPGDSSIGMNVAAQALDGSQLRFDLNADVNETAQHRARRQARRRQERGADPGRRQPEELHAADRAADPGGARHRREGPRLLPADHRRAPRHRRPLRRDAGRGGELGQDRSRPAARHGRVLRRQLDRAAAAHRLRHGAARSRGRSSGSTTGARR